MNKVKIVADSTCDLSEDLIKAHDITVIPLCIVMHEKSYYDGIEITPDEIYSWADANRSTPKTAAASFDKTIEILKPYFDEGREIIFIGISSKMSTTCNVIRLVAEQNNYDKLYVIDSLNREQEIKSRRALWSTHLHIFREAAGVLRLRHLWPTHSRYIP